ncbi:peptide-binding protein [Lederbergia citrea]|uniref:Peptide-binding protein n=1 Tax=Lederbergia citrea TaxID=2833581 RepID=A0A942UP60_9BACI|nr:peptide-binding protein [Lederbergia citrea]MBS4178505.1 peptide-binding protein [Lederbergia citrea]MBS4205176.1 peptide-binding protein [Lederbergia citrea]MBS4222962.1 peptide-binding protein [Lederbergia citrea]
MKKPAWLLVSMMLVLSMFLAACGGKETANETPKNNDTGKKEEEPAKNSEPVDGGDLIIGSSGSPTMFNSLYSSDATSSEIEGFIYDSLLSSDLEFNPTTDNGMAETFEESEDGLTYTVKLREGIKFHDGEPLTADDVVFTYNIPLSKDYDGVRKSTFANLKSVEKVDDLTIQFNMKQVDAQFPVEGFGYGILPKHILGEVPIKDLGEHKFNTKNPIGSGPFKFVEWKDGEYVKVEAFDDYYGGRPHLDSITMKIVPDNDAMMTQLQNRDIDFWAGIPGSEIESVKDFSDAAGIKIEEGLALSYTFFGYNLRNDLFKDKEVRQALTHAIDRESIVANIMDGNGEVADVPESPLSWAYNPDVPKFEYDVEKAKKMLADAGWKPGADGILEKDGKKFSFEVKTNQGNKIREDITVLIQEQLKEVGIEVKPQIVEFSSLIADIDPGVWNFDAIVLGWSLGIDPDPSGIFHTNEIEEGLNFIGYSNPELDKLMDEQLKERDKDKRKEMIGKIQQGLAEDQPYTFLYYPTEFRAMPAELKGYEFHAKDPNYHASKWWLDKE